VPYGYPCWVDSHVPTAAAMRATAPGASCVITCGGMLRFGSQHHSFERGDYIVV